MTYDLGRDKPTIGLNPQFQRQAAGDDDRVGHILRTAIGFVIDLAAKRHLLQMDKLLSARADNVRGCDTDVAELDVAVLVFCDIGTQPS